jgi:hypothetical protein
VLSLEQALDVLPDTAGGIAAHLEVHGIKGGRVRACECALANYLTSLGFTDVMVGHSGISAIGDDRRQRVSTLPAVVHEFMTRFDGGEWPELVDDLEAGDV